MNVHYKDYLRQWRLRVIYLTMSVPCVALMSELFYVLSRIGWLSILLLYSRVPYCFNDD
jgi:hypothetical protein